MKRLLHCAACLLLLGCTGAGDDDATRSGLDRHDGGSEADDDEGEGPGDDESGPSGNDDDEPTSPSGGSAEPAALFADGDPSAATISELFAAPSNMFCDTSGFSCPGIAVDLEFNPARDGELWVVFRQPYDGQPCNAPTPESSASEQAGCALLRSKVAILHDATSDSPDVELKEDGNSWHFMRLVTSLAFADDDSFATVGESRTGNYMDQSVDYMGPTWWSSHPDIFAQDFMLNGSHLDMLHATPFGMGIAHQTAHVFWAFNGQIGSIDRYDFNTPHEPGGADHSDGEYERWVQGDVERLEGVPSHMAFGSDGTTLYVADSGNQRIVALDTQSGGQRTDITTADEQIVAPKEVTGGTLSEIVPRGVVVLPSGLEVWRDHLIVTCAETSLIHLFDPNGEELVTFDTGLERGALAGITVGPDDKVYFVDWPNARVLRIDVD